MLNDMKQTIKKNNVAHIPQAKYLRQTKNGWLWSKSIRQHIQYKLNIIASHNFQL